MFKKIFLSIVSVLLFILSFLFINVNATKRVTPVSLDDELIIEVGEEFTLKDKLLSYVTRREQNKLKLKSNNEKVVFPVNNKLKIYGVKEGKTKVSIESDKYFKEFNVIVKPYNILNLSKDASFSNVLKGSKKNLIKDGGLWSIYTGGVPVNPDDLNREVYVENINDEKIVTINHKNIYHTILYIEIKTLDNGKKIENGNYYLEGEIKTENIEREAYFRLNQGGKTESKTPSIKGTTSGYEKVKTGIIEVENNKIKLELIAATTKGKVSFKNFKINKVLDISYLDFDTKEETLVFEKGKKTKVDVYAKNLTNIDYDYNFLIKDHDILKYDELDNTFIGLKEGITQLIITDLLYGYKVTKNVIVGSYNNKVNPVKPISVEQNKYVDINFDNLTPLIYKYPKYGDIVLENNKIRYYPKHNFNSKIINTLTNGLNDKDTFKLYLVDNNGTYTIFQYDVTINQVYDEIKVINKYIQVPLVDEKNTEILARLEIYSNTYNNAEIRNKIKAPGEASFLAPSVKESLLKLYNENVEVSLLKNAKHTKDGEEVYVENKVFLEKNDYGGDSFFIKFKYNPDDYYTGYDNFYILIKHKDKITKHKVTLYMLPKENDFKFNELENKFKNETYLLTNDIWIKETLDAYNNNDKYLVDSINYYKSKLENYIPGSDPKTERGPLEQLSILYRLTGKDIYKEKAWDILNSLTINDKNQKRLSWGKDTNGFLDAAMATYSVAFSYNLLKQSLSKTQKLQVIKALYEEGIYYFDESRFNNVNVLKHGNNHNLLITANMALSGFSILGYEDEYISVDINGKKVNVNIRKEAIKTIRYAFSLMQIGLRNYSDSGGYIEGPAYSYYGHKNIIALIATLYNLYGKDNAGNINSFDLLSVDGIKNYPIYSLYTESPNHNTFYYNEGNYSKNQPGNLFYARLDEKYIPYTFSNYLSYLSSDETKRYNSYSILWYKPGSFKKIKSKIKLEPDIILKEHELGILRQDFNCETATFVGMKTYNPKSDSFAHASLDSGTFEIEALGEKFIFNPSNEDYINMPTPDGFWKYGYARWLYYKKQPQGHNCLVINPRDYPVLQQSPFKLSKIDKLESGNDISFMVSHLNNPYENMVYSYKRGIMLFDNKKNVLVQDEFVLRKRSDVYFNLHTLGAVNIIDDKTAVININSKNLFIKLLTDGKLVKQKFKPIPQTLAYEGNTKLDNVNKIYIKLENITKGSIKVLFIPSLTNELCDVNEYIKNSKIEEWKSKNIDKTNDIYAENIEFKENLGKNGVYTFNKNQYIYHVNFSSNTRKIPVPIVTYNKDLYDFQIINAKNFGQTTRVVLTSKKTGFKREYHFLITVDPQTLLFYSDEIKSFAINNKYDPLFIKDNYELFKVSDNEEIEVSVDDKITHIKFEYLEGNKGSFQIYGTNDDAYTFLGNYELLENESVSYIRLGLLDYKKYKIIPISNNGTNNYLKISNIKFIREKIQVYLNGKEIIIPVGDSFKYNKKPNKLLYIDTKEEIESDTPIYKEGRYKTIGRKLDKKVLIGLSTGLSIVIVSAIIITIIIFKKNKIKYKEEK